MLGKKQRNRNKRKKSDAKPFPFLSHLNTSIELTAHLSLRANTQHKVQKENASSNSLDWIELPC